MRSLYKAALAAAFALLSPPASADPTLPAGWVAGGPAAPFSPPPPPGRLTREALQLAVSPARSAVTAVPLALADIDTADIGPAPTWAQVEASNAEPAGEDPPDLFVAPGCVRVSATGHALGHLSLGWHSGGITAQSGGGATLYTRGALADGKHLYVRLDWETLDRLPDGTLRFTETVARFHTLTCKAKVARRFQAIARPILDGRAYAFRTRCAACAQDERDQLHVIVGDGGVEPYDHRKLSLAAGGGGGFRTRVEKESLRRFGVAMGRPLPDLLDGKQAVIGVEAAQTLGESAPTLIVYTFDERPRG